MAKRSSRLIACTAIAVLFWAEPSTGEADPDFRLTDSEVELLVSFSESYGSPFVDFFAALLHSREFCLGDGVDCETDLQMRESDLAIVLRGRGEIRDVTSRSVVDEALIRTATQISETTGLNVDFSSDLSNSDFTLIVFVDETFLQENFEDFLAARITRVEFGDVELRRRLFLHFVSSDIPCIYLGSSDREGTIRRSHIWIKSTLDEPTLRRCIAEELFNSLGIDDGPNEPSIFSWNLHLPNSDLDNDELNQFHLLLLRMLYRAGFRPGQSESETRSLIRQIIE